MSLSNFNKLATNNLSNSTRFEINRNQRRLNKAMERLSTGLKNPRAEDDAASFSISAKLSARVAGLNQAQYNVSDAKSMLNIMEESISKIAEILNQVKRYVIQAANGIGGTDEINYLRSSINGLANEITSIVNQTVYNGQQILLKDYSANFTVGEAVGQTISISIDNDLTTQDVQIEEVTTFGVFTSASPITAATNLNSIDQFAGLQGGDSFDITLTKGDGTSETQTLNLAGAKGALTTSTIQSVINTINTSGVFNASFSNTNGGEIIVRETVVTPGNALAVNLGNFVEAPNLDGASGSISFGFDAASGSLRTAFTSAGAINSGTAINSLDQFSLVEGQDSLALNITGRDGVSYAVNHTFSGAQAVTTTGTLGDLRDSINAQQGGKFLASIVAGQLQVIELNKPQNSLNATSSFIEASTDTGAASVSNLGFAQTLRTAKQNTVGVINGGTILQDGAVGIGFGFNPGDTFDIVLSDNTGAVQTITYTFASPIDDYNSLANYITANSNFTASILGGELLITEDNLNEGNSLSFNYQNYVGTGILNNPGSVSSGDTIVTAKGVFGGAYTGATVLNSLAQFTNVQNGDTLTLRLTDNSGATQNVNFTFSGPPSGASTSTINDLIGQINIQTTLNATFNAGLGEILIEDPINSGNGISFSISNADFTELPRPNNGTPTLTFAYSGEEMESNTLTRLAVNANSATRLTEIDGWGTLQGNDVIRVNLRTRAGASADFDFTLNDVATGVTSNKTVGDLVSFLDGASIGAVNFNASLSAGKIVIKEQNAPLIGGFAGSGSFTEFNIDATPKLFTPAAFDINTFLGLASDTGLVIGLGLLDFDSGTKLTQSTAQRLIRNVDQSITRVANQLNELGVIQTSLSNRELFLGAQIIANESAKSRVRDADYAKVYSDMLKAQIIQRYQTASLTQSNLAPASILLLL